MPTVNFRMTDEQHATLVSDAERNQRSLQREIAFRVFQRDGIIGEPGGRVTPQMPRDALPNFEPVRREFRPDPKPVPKPKASRR
jgi:hypothetical protein